MSRFVYKREKKREKKKKKKKKKKERKKERKKKLCTIGKEYTKKWSQSIRRC